MFKEVKNGSYKTLLTILAKFGLQEGVSDRKVKEYFKLLRTSGLITITNGHKSWRYNSEAEWDLFRVNI